MADTFSPKASAKLALRGVLSPVGPTEAQVEAAARVIANYAGASLGWPDYIDQARCVLHAAALTGDDHG